MPRPKGDLRSLLMLPPGRPVDLASIDPRSTPGLPLHDKAARKDPKAWSLDEVTRIGGDLAIEQEKLFASAKVGGDRRRVLLVLQAMDCGGKDGTVKAVAGAMNPLGLHIVSFGPPTPQELAHDFLWRIDRALPEPGYVGIFNRSHYEDVLAARVHSLASRRVWLARYDKINLFETRLMREGFTLVKVMLHISHEEQRERLLARLDDPTKQWKFNPADLDAREQWDEYQEAYADALKRCGTAGAPWHVVPADRKWYRNWAVATLLRGAFGDLRLTYPKVTFDPGEQRERLAGGIDGEQKVNSG